MSDQLRRDAPVALDNLRCLMVDQVRCGPAGLFVLGIAPTLYGTLPSLPLCEAEIFSPARSFVVRACFVFTQSALQA
jgi:hypothetical protein